MNFWKCRMFCIITGASRSLGRTIATQFCQHVEKDSVFLLLARNEDGLEETKRQMLERNNSIKIIIKAVDLSQPNWTEYSKILNDTLKYLEVSSDNFDRSLLVHNAGSLGTLYKNSETLTDIQELRDYLDLNLNSVVILTSVYLKYFKENRFIINISSLAASQAFEGWHLYCTVKAARDSYFRVVAEDKNVSILSYAPGPLDTDMMDEIAKNGTKDQREWVLISYIIALGSLKSNYAYF
ncbi:sepiapterin reductase-like [Centruroides sculpturatus]|uniref:sepiapterin reductase-like n=1 Tax=Centruroides sculpturatus TaxID=218467 RepID=UPI000C6DDF5A|nr:sepiapterin reductase-like [Centruroides sculpturatus]